MRLEQAPALDHHTILDFSPRMRPSYAAINFPGVLELVLVKGAQDFVIARGWALIVFLGASSLFHYITSLTELSMMSTCSGLSPSQGRSCRVPYITRFVKMYLKKARAGPAPLHEPFCISSVHVKRHQTALHERMPWPSALHGSEIQGLAQVVFLRAEYCKTSGVITNEGKIGLLALRAAWVLDLLCELHFCTCSLQYVREHLNKHILVFCPSWRCWAPADILGNHRFAPEETLFPSFALSTNDKDSLSM